MRWQVWAVLAPLGVGGVIAACDLNPQPLPPVDNGIEPSPGSSGSFRGDDETSKTENPTPAPTVDAGTAPNDGEGGAGGDAGDAGDASDDADAG